MYQQFNFKFPDDLDLESVSDPQVYRGFILTLPFRLRIGMLFTVHVGDSFNVVFRNQLEIPRDTPPDDILSMMWVGKKHRPREQFFTEALVLDTNPPVDGDVRTKFVEFLESSGDQKMPEIKARYFQAITSLNDAIVGYHHATSSLFGGTVVQRLTSLNFFDRLRYLHTILSPPGYKLSESELVEILDARSDREFVSVGGQFATHQLDDVPDAQLADIQRYVQLHQRFLFYQFALDAKSKMVEQDLVSAILFAVVALEGVHSALLQMCLDRQMARSLTDPLVRTQQAEATANRLLKNIGLTELLEMTSLLFLDADDRPSKEQMDQCKLGITIRNEIMHVLVKKGEYRLRNRTNQQLCDAYSNVLAVFSHFAAIVERDTAADSEGTKGDGSRLSK